LRVCHENPNEQPFTQTKNEEYGKRNPKVSPVEGKVAPEEDRWKQAKSQKTQGIHDEHDAPKDFHARGHYFGNGLWFTFRKFFPEDFLRS